MWYDGETQFCVQERSGDTINFEIVPKESDAFNVCLLWASLDAGNQGCCALTVSLIKLISDTKPKVRIYLLYGNRTNGTRELQISGKTIKVNIVNYRLSPKASLNEHLLWIFLLACIQRIIPIRSIRDRVIRSNRWLSTLEDADVIGDIRAGDSFSDIYGLCTFLVRAIPAIIAILMRKKFVMLPQTYGPFESTVSRQVARFTMTHATKLLSRDADSIELIQKVLGEKYKHKNIQFCPDVAFVLEPILPKNPDIQLELSRRGNLPLIGLNINSLLYIGEGCNNKFGLKINYRKFIHNLLQELMDRTNAHVLLVPHEYFPLMIDGQKCSEIKVCEKERELIDKRYHSRIHLVKQEYNQNEIKGIIGLCDFFIGSRMHACIAAISQCIPAVGVAYSKKFHGVFETIDLGDCVADMRDYTENELLTKVISTFEKRELVRKHLLSTMPSIRRKIRNVFETL